MALREAADRFTVRRVLESAGRDCQENAMSPIRKILYAIKEPDAAAESGVAKVAALAKSCGASLELFHAVATPLFLPTQVPSPESLESLKNETVEVLKRRLAKLATIARRRRIVVRCTAVWDYPPHDAIVRRADEMGADLIVAQCHPGKRRGWIMQLTDWELLRISERPVLLIKDGKPYGRSGVLAAVDPAHEHAKPVDLDSRILETAHDFAGTLRGVLHVVFANNPSPVGLSYGDPFIGAYPTGLTYDDLRRQHRELFDRFMVDSDVPEKRRHVIAGEPAEVIPRVARATHAGIVVMGAVSRTGLKRLFIGNTAERMLAELPCDVLVVKPGAFRQHVAPERRGAIVLTPPGEARAS
jgi:universal stress protein E